MGYFYQLVGTAGYKIELLQSAAGTGDVDSALIRLDVERANQDAVAMFKEETRLIQFKYSGIEANIPPSELADILRTLKNSESSLPNLGSKVTWILRTNRAFSLMSDKLIRRVPKINLGKTSKADADVIRGVGSKLVRQSFTMAQVRQQLESRAKRFGVSDLATLPQRVAAYLLSLIGRPEGQRVVEQNMLDEALAGYDQPRSLDAEDIRDFALEEISAVARELQGTPLDQIEPREEIETLLRTPDIGIAIVTGHGGCGKTRSVLRSLRDLLRRRPCLVATLMPGPQPAVESFEALVARWRSRVAVPVETLDQSAKRIRLANESTFRPILLVALDAIDETASSDAPQRHISQLISYFRRAAQSVAPDALLLVTCRVAETFEDLCAPEGPGGVPEQTVTEVKLADFTIPQFVAIWRRWFKGEEPPEISSPPGPGSGTAIPPRPPRPPTRVDALLHPALLGCVQQLTDGERHALMREDDAAWICLLTHYLAWFARKVQRRRGYMAADVWAILKAAARFCEGKSNGLGHYYRDEHWISPAAADTGFAPEGVRRVFNEAVSCGLIESPDQPRYATSMNEPVPWMWRFAFLQRHLVTLS